MKSREIRKFRKTYTDYKKKCLFEGYRLAVLFDEKDLVKRMGGRWDAEEQTWWMPAKNLKNDAEQYGGPPNGSLVEDYLNDMQMVMGQYGELKQENALDHNHYTEYGLHKSNNEPQFKVQFYYEQDVVVFVPTGMGDLETEYLTVEEGRKRWDNLIECGYNRVENS
jgi:hypothetical protein